LWEIYTDGGRPYAGLSNLEVTDYVCEGKRLKKPSKCPEIVYHLMMKCWDSVPKNRPLFDALYAQMEEWCLPTSELRRISSSPASEKEDTKEQYMNEQELSSIEQN
jgi:hypothetical protein